MSPLPQMNFCIPRLPFDGHWSARYTVKWLYSNSPRAGVLAFTSSPMVMVPESVAGLPKGSTEGYSKLMTVIFDSAT